MLNIPSYLHYSSEINIKVKDKEIYKKFQEVREKIDQEVSKINKILLKHQNQNLKPKFVIEENENVRLNFTYSDNKKEWLSYYVLNTNMFSNSSFVMDFNQNEIIFKNVYEIINSVQKEIDIISLLNNSKELLILLKEMYTYKETSVEESLKIIKKEFKQSRKENINLIIENIKKSNKLDFMYELSFYAKNGRSDLYIKKINYLLENIYFYENHKVFRDMITTGKNPDIAENDIFQYISNKLKDNSNIYITKMSEKELKEKYNIESLFKIDINQLAEFISLKKNIKNF